MVKDSTYIEELIEVLVGGLTWGARSLSPPLLLRGFAQGTVPTCCLPIPGLA